jgi:hypothetical protein
MALVWLPRMGVPGTSPSMNPSDTPLSHLSDPVWTIQHLATCFHVSVDTAREYTYRGDFPGTHLLGARLLWDREEVLSWFRCLPSQTAADRRRETGPAVPATVTTYVPRPAGTYRPRASRRAA